MNTTLRSFARIGALASATLFLGLVGCQTTGVSRASTAATALREHARWIEGLKQQVAATTAALDEVVQSSRTDPRAPYRKFARAVARTERDAEGVWKHFVAVEGSTDEYLRYWESEVEAIGNADLRKLSRERRDQSQARLQQIKQAETTLRQQFRSFTQNLKDVQVYLNNNLNPSGIVAATDQIAAVKNEASRLQLETDTLIAKVNELKLAISPQQAAPSRR